MTHTVKFSITIDGEAVIHEDGIEILKGTTISGTVPPDNMGILLMAIGDGMLSEPERVKVEMKRVQ